MISVLPYIFITKETTLIMVLALSDSERYWVLQRNCTLSQSTASPAPKYWFFSNNTLPTWWKRNLYTSHLFGISLCAILSGEKLRMWYCCQIILLVEQLLLFAKHIILKWNAFKWLTEIYLEKYINGLLYSIFMPHFDYQNTFIL